MVHTVTVYDRIRQQTIIYDRIRQSYSSVYGVQTFTFKSLRIFIRSPYTVSIFHRFTPYTVPVYGLRMSPFFTVNDRLRPCMFDLGELLRKNVTISIKGRKTKGEITLSVLYEKKRFFLSRANKTRGKLTLIVSDKRRLFLLRWEKNQTKNNSKRIM